MKKVLFATTALVLSAGVAAAEVAVSGSGRMGVVYDGADWNFSSRARVTFTMTGQTDNGLEFGGSFDAHDSAAANTGNAGTVWISGAFGKIAMGDVASAPEALFGDLPEVGYTDLESAGGLSNDIPYLTLDNGTQSALLYTYSAGAFSVAASMSDGNNGADAWGWDDADDDETTAPVWAETKADKTQVYAIAAAYTAGNYTVGLGYEVLDYDTAGVKSTKQIELAAVATFGDTSVKAYYADQKEGIVDKAFGLGVASKFGATGVNAYVQKAKFVDGTDVTWYGLGASYDLGGGASVVGGIADNDAPGTDAVADLGVKFTF